MNLVNVNVYGEAYYSGVEYREAIFLLEEDYLKLEQDFNGVEISLGELDGKHSEVFGEVEVEYIPEEKQLDYRYNLYDDDGEHLYWELFNVAYDKKMKLEEMIKRANDYIDNLDSLVEVTYTIRKSQIQKLNDWVNNNIK
ncbi:hypothetical protein EJM73_08515 [Clostridium botulinum]|uniref:hypothetical protein n=1 Tax=Clostridium botulinum TaxID=1491 RepID=UPI00137585D3|nr:hypothetical protein [Clostridium botulinum]NCI19942.1 hypothetical protein [Clostridium botulinum]NCI35704.1 hypothetical protein [Clostridium botulinum]NCI71561.1 hypothetical protein [Clostridium botulinum]NDI38753.1 hypothetical protein [Clostridium botulinum]HCL4447116.1 hypothetical protein [Clostridium botulinum]